MLLQLFPLCLSALDRQVTATYIYTCNQSHKSPHKMLWTVERVRKSASYQDAGAPHPTVLCTAAPSAPPPSLPVPDCYMNNGRTGERGGEGASERESVEWDGTEEKG